MGALLQKKNFILLPFAAECHIQGANANSPKYKLRLTIHSEMCVAWSTPAHHSCPSGTVTYLRILSGINLCTSAFKLSTASQCGLEHTPNTAVNYSQSLYNIKSCCILGLCSGFYISLLHMPSPSLMNAWLCIVSIYEAVLLLCSVDASDIFLLLLSWFKLRHINYSCHWNFLPSERQECL